MVRKHVRRSLRVAMVKDEVASILNRQPILPEVRIGIAGKCDDLSSKERYLIHFVVDKILTDLSGEDVTRLDLLVSQEGPKDCPERLREGGKLESEFDVEVLLHDVWESRDSASY